jgi:hypothetical protein
MILRLFSKSIALVAFCGALLVAGPIDGRWTITMTPRTEGKGKTRTTTLEIKSVGDQLQGTISAGKKLNASIDKGTINGGDFTFVTKLTTKKGDRTIYWKGTVDGDQLKGVQSAKQGAKHGREFTAKRAG